MIGDVQREDATVVWTTVDWQYRHRQLAFDVTGTKNPCGEILLRPQYDWDNVVFSSRPVQR